MDRSIIDLFAQDYPGYVGSFFPTSVKGFEILTGIALILQTSFGILNIFTILNLAINRHPMSLPTVFLDLFL